MHAVHPEEVRMEARSILEKHSFPVNPWRILRSLGVECIRIPLPNVSMSGCLARCAGRFWVVVNLCQNRAPGRERFTLAHELGHYVLHRLWPFSWAKDPEVARAMDADADLFAAELLMPSEEVLRTAASAPPGQAARAVARRCGVTPAAARVRLQELGWEEKSFRPAVR